MYKISLHLLPLLFCTTSLIAQINPQFNPIPASFGINTPNPVYATDINYDDIDLEKQVFHLFLPDTTGNFPLVVFIHGGGFTGGSPDVVLANPNQQADIQYFLENGFAYASFGYRLISTSGPDEEGVIKSLNDSKRALQFVRYHANTLNINPEQIALAGGSAGAGTSLWLGTRDDMADPDATDPVLQESTRVCAVVANGSQATYDLYKWESQIYHNFDEQGTNYTLDSIVNLLGFDRASNFYGGLDSVYQVIQDPALIQYREDVDMLFHMSSDDPPIYINSGSSAIHPSQDLFHHPFHGREINTAALAANISEVKANIPALSINTTDDESRNEFLVRHLSGCAQITGLAQNISPDELKIYPNPANMQITVSLTNETIQQVEIYTLSGQLITAQQGTLSTTISLPVSALAPGIYMVRVRGKEGDRLARKLIIE